MCCLCTYWQVVPVLLHLVTAISAIRLYIPQDLRPLDNRMSVLKSVQVGTPCSVGFDFLLWHCSLACHCISDRVTGSRLGAIKDTSSDNCECFANKESGYCVHQQDAGSHVSSVRLTPFQTALCVPQMAINYRAIRSHTCSLWELGATVSDTRTCAVMTVSRSGQFRVILRQQVWTLLAGG